MIGPLLVFAQLGAALPATRPTVQRPTAAVTSLSIDANRPVSFRALVAPDTVYVGQQATYQLGVFVDASVRGRLRRLEARAPEMRGLMAYDPTSPRRPMEMNIGRRRFAVHVYQRPVFPLAPGRLVLPPASLAYAMPLTFSFFSREESYELQSDSAVLTVLPLPEAGRPPDFDGAVGSLSLSSSLDSTGARAGNPVRLIASVSGAGNIELLPRPRIAIPWASIVPGAERVSLSTDSLTIGGTKSFEWIITPRQSGRLLLPSVRYPVFDPATGRYEVLTTAPETLVVAPGSLVAAADTLAPVPGRLSLRTVYRGAVPQPLYARTPFWFLLATAPLPAALLAIARRRLRPAGARSARPSDVSERLHALARARQPAPVRVIRQAFTAALVSRLRLPPRALASPAALERVARRAGVTRGTAAALSVLLAELDSGAFGEARTAGDDVAVRASQILRAVDREARRLGVLDVREVRDVRDVRHVQVVRDVRDFRQVRTVLCLALSLALAAPALALFALAPTPEAERFASGVARYRAQRYGAAAADFATVARRVPRAADAWANLGTAAWAAGDTARAVLGWQRAVRLEPLRSADARERLSLLPTPARGVPGALPLVPPEPLALAAALLWLGAWSMAARAAWLATPVYQRRSRRTSPRRSSLERHRALAPVPALLAGALLLGGAALDSDRHLAARNLAITSSSAVLRADPALAGEPRGSVSAGEIVRVVRGGTAPWASVATAGNRSGWLERTRLLPLARD